jgi:hypothetical protein
MRPKNPALVLNPKYPPTTFPLLPLLAISLTANKERKKVIDEQEIYRLFWQNISALTRHSELPK